MAITFGEFLREMVEFPVHETPHQKAIRINRKYTKIVRIDAAKFKERFESEQGQKLDWNPGRLDRLKDLESVDSYPQVFIDWAGRVDVLDGRHRIATAAAKGMSIKVATPATKKESAIPADLLI